MTIERSGFAAVAGRPNVGKSTLLNCLVEDKVSIVSHRRQTTRSIIRALTEENKSQIAWLDTPGWQVQHGGSFNRALNGAAEWAVSAADLVVFVTAAATWTSADTALLAKLPDDKPTIGVINKADLIGNKNELLPMIDALNQRRKFTEIIPLSALTGKGVDVLKKRTAALLPLRAAMFIEGDAEGTEGRNFLFAELLREKLFRYLGEELPYVAGVVTESVVTEKKLVRIDSLICVEKESQKKIIIGKGGSMLKKLASAARLDMEDVCRSKVFLSVRVRVSDWRNDEMMRRRMRIGRGG